MSVGGRRPPLRWPLALLSALVGCHATEDPPLVVATPWPLELRASVESTYRSASRDPRPITWVSLDPGARVRPALERRGGVDVLLGLPLRELDALAQARRLETGPTPSRRPTLPSKSGDPPELPRSTSRTFTDPRDDPEALAEADRILQEQGWDRGFDHLVRQAGSKRLARGTVSPGQDVLAPEGLAIVRQCRSPEKARAFVASIASSQPSPDSASVDAPALGLLADLLGAALVDARDELGDALRALERYDHPAKAESALGERPPWPPASVVKLRSARNGSSLLETLAEQVAPDVEARAWLLESWARPSRAIDGRLLAELANAAHGNLVLEPRFRGWLRGEWTAWMRQHFRRVARVAGGYVPS
jgi:hypothetical protein